MTCQSVFTTHERIELESALSVNRNNHAEPFLPDLLLKELMLALKHRKDVYRASREVLATILHKLLTLPQRPLFTPEDISKETASVLKRFDHRGYLRYIADHPSFH